MGKPNKKRTIERYFDGEKGAGDKNCKSIIELSFYNHSESGDSLVNAIGQMVGYEPDGIRVNIYYIGEEMPPISEEPDVIRYADLRKVSDCNGNSLFTNNRRKNGFRLK